MAVAQLRPASSISWSTLKPYSLKSSSSMCWASSCLWGIDTSVHTHRVSLGSTFMWDKDSKLHPRYLMVCAMVDAALLLKQPFLCVVAAVDSGHVPVCARTAAALDVTRKPIPNTARTLNIQMDPSSWNGGEMRDLSCTEPSLFPTRIPGCSELREE